MGRLLTVFNKFVILGLILIQSLVLNTFVMLLTSLSAKNLVQTYWLRWIPEVFITSGTSASVDNARQYSAKLNNVQGRY